MAYRVGERAADLMDRLAKVTEDEAKIQERRRARVWKRLELAERELKQIGPAASEEPGGHGRGRKKRTEEIRALRREEQEITARLC